ncbi:MAG: RICIN domain-containing protein [Desulforegulaceae bacterium]|nr:RICIN domain-containing protein [Desulforegulaceae bacterium]
MRYFYFKIVTLIIIVLGMGINLNALPLSGATLPTGKKLIIQSAVNYGRDAGGCWEKAGGGSLATKGDNIRVWTLDNAATKRFTLVQSNETGWYEIYIGDLKSSRVDAASGKLNKGDNIHIWETNRSKAQKFLFSHLGNGRYKIYTKNGRIVNLEDQQAKNGTNIQLWDDHDGLHNEWYLLDNSTRAAVKPLGHNTIAEKSLKGTEVPPYKFYIQSAMSYGRSNRGYLEFPGKDWNYKGNTMDIWTKDSGLNKLFKFEKPYHSSHYIIRAAHSGDGVIDCRGGKTTDGTPLHLWTKGNNNQAQQFYLKHLGSGRFKIYHKSGKVVCLKNNKTDKNGNKVHIWKDHNSITTEWYLINAYTNKAYIPNK